MRPAAAKWLRRVSLAVIVVLLTAMAGLAWLLGTAAGARFAIGFVEDRVPVQFAEVDGSLLGTLRLGGVRYADDALSADIDSAEISVAPGVLWNFRSLTVEQLTVRGVRVTLAVTDEGSSAAADPFVVPAMPRVALPVDLTLNGVRIEDARIEAADGRSLLTLHTLTLAGNWRDDTIDVEALSVSAVEMGLELSGQVSLNPALPLDLRVDWQIPGARPLTGSGALTIAGTRDNYRISHQLDVPLVGQTSGSVRLPQAMPVSVSLVTQVAEYALTAAEREIVLRDIELAIDGGWRNWRLRLGGAVDTADMSPGRLNVNATGDGTNASIEQAALLFNDGAGLELEGIATLSAAPDWDLRVSATRVPLRLASPELGGDVNALLQVVGLWGEQRRVAADIEKLDGTLREVPFNAAGSIDWRPQATRFDALTVNVGDNRVQIEGSVDAAQSADLTVDAQLDNLSQLLPAVNGDLTVGGRVYGTVASPGADLRVQSGGITWRGLALGVAEASARVDGEQVAVTLDAASLRDGELSVTDITLSVDGQQAAHEIALSGNVQGDKPVSLAARGGLADGAWTGQLTSLQLSAPGFSASPQMIDVALIEPASLAIAANDYRIGDFCLSTTLSSDLCARLGLTDGQLDAELNVSGVALASLVPVSATGIRWTGDAALTATLNGPLGGLNGEARVRFDNLLASKGEGETLTTLPLSDAALELTLQAGSLKLSGGALLPDSGRIGMTLDVGDLGDSDAALAGMLTLETEDLSSLNALLDTFRVRGGTLRGSIALSGSRSAPVLNSRINVSSLQARVVPLGIVLEDVSLTAVNVDSDTLRFTGGGRSGDGSFTVVGATQIDERRDFTTTANVKAENFTFIDLPDRFGVASMDIAVKADRRELMISGPLSVDRADVTVNELPEGAVQLSPDERIIAGDGIDEVERVRLTQKRLIDVTVTLSDDVSLEGFGLTTGLNGSLRLRQRRTTPLQGFGTLRLKDATYKAYGQTLDVSRGNLVFNGPLDSPLLDFRAERTVESTLVGIDIRGTPDALESSLFSTPGLPEAEIFSLLLTGRSLSSAGQAEGNAMSDAAITLGLRQAFGVSSAIRDVVGLDTLTVVGSGRDGRVLAGKQISPNLYLQYAYGVFDQLSTVLLRLKLSERLSLESSTGETQSVDLIYSVGRN